MAERLPECPRCGLPMESRDAAGEWQPNCNPLRSPDCWSVIGKLDKAGSPERAIIQRASAKGRPQG